MERGEYDGEEWWNFKTKPIKPPKHRVPKQLHVPERLIGWMTLEEIEKELLKEESKGESR